MNNKYKIKIVVFILLFGILFLSLASCNKNRKLTNNYNIKDSNFFGNNYSPIDYSQMVKIPDIDAYDVLMNAYNNWTSDTKHMRSQTFSLETNAAISTITYQFKQIIKISGNSLFTKKIAIQKSEPFKPNRNEISKYYYDGKTAKKGYINSKDAVPGTSNNIFHTTFEPIMNPFNGEGIEAPDKMVEFYRTNLATYIWQNTDNWSNSSNRSVYKDKNGHIRFTMAINCSKEKMDNIHVETKKEFLDYAGVKNIQLTMLNDAVFDFIIEEVSSKNNITYKFLGWRRTEEYAVKKGIITIPSKQTCIELFSYLEKDYTITDDDIK